MLLLLCRLASAADDTPVTAAPTEPHAAPATPAPGAAPLASPAEGAAAPPARVRRAIPWFTVSAWSYAGSGLAWHPGREARPTVAGGVAVLGGPALLLFSKRDPGTGAFDGMEGSRIDAGLSAGFLARLDTPRAGVDEVGSRAFGGYLRLGQMDEAGVESRHTLAVGWRSPYDEVGVLEREGRPLGQLDLTLVTERRLLPPVAVTASLGLTVGNEALPWGLVAGAGVMLGL